MTHISRKRRTISVLAVAALIAPVAGCATAPANATGPTPASAVGPVSGLPGKDIAHWVMPMDQFSTPTLPHLENYAENRWMETCMTREGFTWPIPIEPTDDASYVTFPANMSDFPALTVEIAKKYGYTANYMTGVWLPDGTKNFTRLNRIAASQAGFETVFEPCLSEIRKTFPSIKASDAFNTMNGWRYEASKVAYAVPSVKKSGFAWKQCLANAGYEVDIPAPAGDGGWMPTEKLGVQIGMYQPRPTQEPSSSGGSIQARGDPEGDPDATGPRAPIPAEIDLAVADATCRDSSGWTKAYYAAQWDAEIEQVRQHHDQLKQMKADIEAITAQARQIIADNPPLH